MDKEHKQVHKKLHFALDELLADYIKHHPKQIEFLSMPVKQLMDWSFEQVKD